MSFTYHHNQKARSIKAVRGPVYGGAEAKEEFVFRFIVPS